MRKHDGTKDPATFVQFHEGAKVDSCWEIVQKYSSAFKCCIDEDPLLDVHLTLISPNGELSKQAESATKATECANSFQQRAIRGTPTPEALLGHIV